MGLFDVFGNSKKKEEEEKRILEERAENDRKSTIEEQKQAHAHLHWPTIPRFNRMNVKDAEQQRIEDPINAERKDEIGALIYEPRIAADDVRALDLNELLFLHAAHLLYNREAPLPDYEANHRVIYNDILRRIHEAADLYVIYDRKSGYPLIDNGFINVYLDQEHAEKASAIYNTQFRSTAVAKRMGENAEPDENGRKPVALFDYLYYLGTENVMLDNGWYKTPIKRSEISAPIGFNADPKKTPPSNPSLSYALTDYVQEIAWPVKYEKRDENIETKQKRMFALVRGATFLVPTMVTETEETAADNAKGTRKEVKFPIINAGDKKLLPIYTDIFEYSKNHKGGDNYRPAGFALKNLVPLLGGVDGLIINCSGQKLFISKAKAAELIKTE